MICNDFCDNSHCLVKTTKPMGFCWLNMAELGSKVRRRKKPGLWTTWVRRKIGGTSKLSGSWFQPLWKMLVVLIDSEVASDYMIFPIRPLRNRKLNYDKLWWTSVAAKDWQNTSWATSIIAGFNPKVVSGWQYLNPPNRFEIELAAVFLFQHLFKILAWYLTDLTYNS